MALWRMGWRAMTGRASPARRDVEHGLADRAAAPHAVFRNPTPMAQDLSRSELALYDACVNAKVSKAGLTIGYVTALEAIADYLDDRVSWDRSLPDPTMPGQALSFRATDKQWETARDKFRSAATKAREAYDETDAGKAAVVFRGLLGENGDGDLRPGRLVTRPVRRHPRREVRPAHLPQGPQPRPARHRVHRHQLRRRPGPRARIQPCRHDGGAADHRRPAQGRGCHPSAGHPPRARPPRHDPAGAHPDLPGGPGRGRGVLADVVPVA